MLRNIVLAVLLSGVGAVPSMVELVLEGHVFDYELLHIFAEILVFGVELIDYVGIAAPLECREQATVRLWQVFISGLGARVFIVH